MLTRWTALAAVIFVSGTALSLPMDGKGLQGTVVPVAQFGCYKKVKSSLVCINHRRRVCTWTTYTNCKVTKYCKPQVLGTC